MLRRRVTVVQFLLIAVAVCLAFSLVRGRRGGPTERRTYAASIALGVAPWPFAFVTTIGPDSLNASVAFFGLVLLVRRRLFLGSLILSLTVLLRPEMIAVVPVAIGAAIFVHRPRLRGAAVAMVAFLLVVAAQYGYRTWFVGKPTLSLFGGLNIYNAGAFAWANSWLGTEDEAYDFVYGLGHPYGRGELPARAFADAQRSRSSPSSIHARVSKDSGPGSTRVSRRWRASGSNSIRWRPACCHGFGTPYTSGSTTKRTISCCTP